MEILLVGIIALVVLALIFDFTNGFHDAANSVAAIVATKTLPAKWAPAFAAFFNFSAYFIIGTAVANTIAKTVTSDFINLGVIFAALVAAIMWNFLTWRFGMPTSSSHAIIGGLVGAGLAVGGWAAISTSSLTKAGIGILAAPLIAFSLAYVVMLSIRGIQRLTHWNDDHRVFKVTQLFTAGAVSFGHGANDAQKTMGVIAALLLATGYTTMDANNNVAVPEWVALSAYSVIALGTLWGGWKIIQTMGLKITSLRASSGAAADIGSAVAIFGATQVGVPVSTTHAAASSIAGAGAGHKAPLHWKVIGQMVLAWVITIPSTIAIAFAMYQLTTLPTPMAYASIGTVLAVFGTWAVWAMIHSIKAKDVQEEVNTVYEEIDDPKILAHAS